MKNDMLMITRRTINLFVVVTIAAILAIATVGWWAASEIDEEAVEDQVRLARNGLDALNQQLPKNQESVTVWSESILAARKNDEQWLADNVVEWMGYFYGYERVYLLDGANQPIRSARNGKLASNSSFEADAPALMPLIEKLRAEMAQAVEGLSETREALEGLFVVDYAAFPDGSVARVSIRPLVHSDDSVMQAPGTEYLHVVARTLGEDLSGKLESQYGLHNLAFLPGTVFRASRASLEIRNEAGEVLGGFFWDPHRPARALIGTVAPMAVAGLFCAAALIMLQMIRLRRISDDLAASKAKTVRLAFYDSLTGIPNRALFQDRLAHALEMARRNSDQIALHYLDLDGFKNVNDTLGHPVGDRLLVEVAQRLLSIGRASDTIARLSGDEFAIIQVGVANDAEAEALSARIIRELNRPFDLDGDYASIGASVGIALSRVSDTSEDMLRKADVALYQAKESGRGCFQIFVEDMDDIVRKRRAIGRDLKVALEKGRSLQLRYEPIHGVKKGELVGVEARLRWDNPDYCGIRPDIIIALAESSGLLPQLGEFALNEICAFAASCEVPWVIISMTPAHFQNERLADRILEVIAGHGIAPGRIHFEIRNGERLRLSERVRACLARLRAAGVGIVLTNFSTDETSLRYLREFGVDKLKINRAFINALGNVKEARAIIGALVALAHALKIDVVVEEVETEQEREMLRDIGCTEFQGPLISPALPASQMRSLLSYSRNGGSYDGGDRAKASGR